MRTTFRRREMLRAAAHAAAAVVVSLLIGCSVGNHSWKAAELAGTYKISYRTWDDKDVTGTMVMRKDGTYVQRFAVNERASLVNRGKWETVRTGSSVLWYDMLIPWDASRRPAVPKPDVRSCFMTQPMMILGRISIEMSDDGSYSKVR